MLRKNLSGRLLMVWIDCVWPWFNQLFQ